MRYVAVTLFTLLCVMSAVPVDAVDPERVGGGSLRQGVFLFASPRLYDPNFLQTVVLLVTYGKGGASGLIINRPTEIPLPKALPDIEGIEKMSQPVYFGGPVDLNLMLALLRADASLPGAQHVLADIYFTADRKILTDALRDRNPGRTVRVYAGYSGWGPGQLDREFARGDWITVDADPESVFSEDPSKLWSTFFENRGKIQIRFPAPGGDYTVSPGTVVQ
ncbi:MAG: YqgE/AlgH family protein [Nitrospirae bacterium]|nr:YqgE/AlgH family protein [Nitrospirota bacterium]